MEATFEHLRDTQKAQARAMFFDAGRKDGYWYTTTEDGRVLSRNRMPQLDAEGPEHDPY